MLHLCQGACCKCRRTLPDTSEQVIATVLQAGEHTALDAALKQAELEQTRLILLFPSPDALPINEVAADRATASQSQSHYTLLLLDSTWQFANEMFRALQERLLPPNGHATLAALSANVAAQTPDGAESVLSFVPADGVLAVAHGAAHELTKSASTIEGHPRSSKRSETSPLLLRTEPLVRAAYKSDTTRLCATAVLCTTDCYRRPEVGVRVCLCIPGVQVKVHCAGRGHDDDGGYSACACSP